MSRYHLLPEDAFIEEHKKFINSSSEDKVTNAGNLYWQMKCIANNKGMDIQDLYLLLLFIKSDIEQKCPQIKELVTKFIAAEEEFTQKME